MYCAETEGEVQEGYTKWLPGSRFSATKHYGLDDPDHFQATRGYEQYAAPVAGPAAEATHEQVSADRVAWHTSSEPERIDFEKSNPATVIGTPDQCVAKLKLVIETTASVLSSGSLDLAACPRKRPSEAWSSSQMKSCPRYTGRPSPTPSCNLESEPGPANAVLQREIAHLLVRPAECSSKRPIVSYFDSAYQALTGT
jgi:hypothetical protein